MLLLIDNYDSFVFNLARYFERLGQATHVVRNDAIDAAGVASLNPAAVVISPGPGVPRQAGCCLDVARTLHERIPLLGVCLGHQAIAEGLGGRVIRAPEPVHGRTSLIEHTASGIFADIPNPLTVCRYHSLVVQDAALPESLQVTARTADGAVMALEHRRHPVFGVQFHPEAILTEEGYPLLANFLAAAGLASQEVPRMRSEQPEPRRQPPQPNKPVTF